MAKEQLFADKSPLERLNLLEGMCDGVTIETYEVPLEEASLESYKDRVVDLSVQKRGVEERKARFDREIKKELKPINEELSDTITILKRGTELKDGKLYKIIEGRTAKMYDADGMFIYSRPLRQDENQMSIKETFEKASNE